MIKKISSILVITTITLSFNSKKIFAQDFQTALNQYVNEFQIPYFQGHEITPMWFEIESGPWLDGDGDGIGDYRIRRNVFRLFGRIIWRSSETWIEDREGNVIG